jgi:hypothetical protein
MAGYRTGVSWSSPAQRPRAPLALRSDESWRARLPVFGPYRGTSVSNGDRRSSKGGERETLEVLVIGST